MLHDVEHATVSLLDRWSVQIRRQPQELSSAAQQIQRMSSLVARDKPEAEQVHLFPAQSSSQCTSNACKRAGGADLRVSARPVCVPLAGNSMEAWPKGRPCEAMHCRATEGKLQFCKLAGCAALSGVESSSLRLQPSSSKTLDQAHLPAQSLA